MYVHREKIKKNSRTLPVPTRQAELEQERGMAVERRRMYVSVQRRTIFSDPEAESYEFKVDANEEEIQHLQGLMDQLGEAETDIFHNILIIAPVETAEKLNMPYQQRLNAVYMCIHKLGTAETKRFIEQMLD
ncbi:hypothetical protein WJ0W_000542 [Paenibacillus melissococcoides]|uniref:Uncharacterized protein n=1 Tax=Paenibacillus melissococcoides TaxID=2912268 RepID=A0ABN8TZW0_9BACL|nr:hypothetical protein WJ0W_000542 [Paenibacillus melissococcoides]